MGRYPHAHILVLLPKAHVGRIGYRDVQKVPRPRARHRSCADVSHPWPGPYSWRGSWAPPSRWIVMLQPAAKYREGNRQHWTQAQTANVRDLAANLPDLSHSIESRAGLEANEACRNHLYDDLLPDGTRGQRLRRAPKSRIWQGSPGCSIRGTYASSSTKPGENQQFSSRAGSKPLWIGWYPCTAANGSKHQLLQRSRGAQQRRCLEGRREGWDTDDALSRRDKRHFIRLVDGYYSR